jgi:hypothetical protein
MVKIIKLMTQAAAFKMAHLNQDGATLVKTEDLELAQKLA